MTLSLTDFSNRRSNDWCPDLD